MLAYLRTQADTLRRYDPLVRRDAPDAVHKMRVSSRRLRSALQAYRRVLDRDATRPLTDELKWLAGELAPARDTEVMAARFGEMVDELPAELVLGPVSATLDRTFARQQARGPGARAGRPGQRPLPGAAGRHRRAARRPPADRPGRPAGATASCPRTCAGPTGGCAAGWRPSTSSRPESSATSALHETRKAAKRLRYATEAAEPAVGKPAKRLRKRLKPVQSLLGDHQDTVVARPVLRELGAQVHQDGGNGFTFGLLHGIEAARAERAERAAARPVETDDQAEEHGLAGLIERPSFRVGGGHSVSRGSLKRRKSIPLG